MERILPFSLELDELKDVMPDGYYEKRIEIARSGKPVWITRSFDSGACRIIDLYAQMRLVGSVDIDYSHPEFRSAMLAQPMVPSESEGYIHLTDRPVPLGEAMRLVEQDFNRRTEIS